MNPRTLKPDRHPFTTVGSIRTNKSINSCSEHKSVIDQDTVITWKLDKAYNVDAILLMGFDDKDFHLSEFDLYVGYSNDYKENTPCPDGPFAYPVDSTYGT